MFIRTRFARWLSFGFANGITLFPFVLIAPTVRLSRRMVIHERIHLRQQKEMLVLPFYLQYLLEYGVGLLKFGSRYQAYRHISFEQEAYSNDTNSRYLQLRPAWNWRRYL